jgi:hypothetical protein
VTATPNRGPSGRNLGVVGNERLTALSSAVLLVLFLVELATTARLGSLISIHVFAGVLLVGPLAVKVASTGYKALRYYAGSPAYVRQGPPRLPLRVLAPILLGATVLLLGSGLVLVLVGPTASKVLVAVHVLSFVVWMPAFAVHAIAYVWRVPGIVAGDLRADDAARSSGQRLRLGGNVVALGLAGIGAALLLPDATAWLGSLDTEQKVPGFLLGGTVLTVLALIATRPLRWA